MFKRLQGFFIGFFACALLFGGISYAAVELNVVPNPFPVLINGSQATVEGYNINGYTFLKLADFKQAGLTIKFNETDRQIEITNSAIIGSEVTDKGENTMSDLINQTPDGIPVEMIGGEAYVSTLEIRSRYLYNADKCYEILIKPDVDGQIKLIKIEKTDTYVHKRSVLIENIPFKHVPDAEIPSNLGTYYVGYDYYVNNILPLIDISPRY